MAILASINFQWVLLSATFLGIAAGMFGTLAYWKRQSLMSDALSHAALPGVVIAFMIINEKNFFILILGAALSALLGAWFIYVIRSSSRIKEDTAMGIILSVFFGAGIVLLTLVNRSGSGSQSGLDTFIFGQAASMVRLDVYTMVILATAIIVLITFAYKEWKLFLFDPEFARGIGLSSRGMDIAYMIGLVTTIVIGIQAVGVILMAALLIIPAVSARYWTQSFKIMLLLSGIFGGLSGAIGTFLSAQGAGWPTGPFIVLSASIFFVFSLFFGKEKGFIAEKMEFRAQQRQALSENEAPGVLKEGGHK
ncbi:metal ABC transporter permease [Shouchella lehensis]|uniref:Manganese transport system membrane protein mntC n=2 Tax=Shouchella lehensis TaxID=300825 RepID=A0A060M8E8_9BACI|nr:iron chelate uptake ABC transporter family permease subunit [Shouchella lehensis]AIC96364.1 Manganese transport system membrane protein mntC [Shouchella lehensis G1]MBG9785236.1 manganese ABC transporter [Shouchella lehensis]RQW18961.1 metal ABC transporter permease [Bacillus sp. C1-1]TES46681.1 metal ABC transporter permease [Shouchella lehensis]